MRGEKWAGGEGSGEKVGNGVLGEYGQGTMRKDGWIVGLFNVNCRFYRKASPPFAPLAWHTPIVRNAILVQVNHIE